MTYTTHTAIGAVIGQISGHPILGFLLAFFVHFLVDMIPHGDSKISDNYRIYKRKRKQAIAYVMIDTTIAIFFILFLFNIKDIVNTRMITWGIIGSVLPDTLIGLYEVTKWKYLKSFYHLHFVFHNYVTKRHGDIPLSYAIFGQIILIILLQSWL
ncbi:hypothetical protein CO172_00450 [Candidatus Uhrbacteria bacterium CG_4_9_14_3_um_filter_36_7]|uniref:DUF3307 domain-containing protein n=1 Tax=Candidatus Uhrbacteria bacterium CG_4_9_14_3_um_filter_36_7 TaxID=1975033 RepID=A0A2M7XID3_9BACT|nr:MAG: hypothetical protein CO172_00450 [Candidatus Uhrbacteria bacterium CG_4_9_14_3_um_filter_36_7]